MSTASQPVKHGKRLRWARNVVKNWEADYHKRLHGYEGETRGVNSADVVIRTEIKNKRYERACGLILADKLRK